MTNPFMDLQPGDQIIVTGGISNVQRLTQVTRVTKTQIITDSDERYRKVDGFRVGDSNEWHPYRLIEATPGNLAKQTEWQQKQDWFDVLWELELIARRLKNHDLSPDQKHLIIGICNELINAERNL